MPLAIGEQTTTIVRRPEQVRERRARSRSPPHAILGVDAERALPRAARTRRASSSTSSASPIRRRPRASSRSGFIGVDSYPEEQRTYPQGTVGAAGVGYAGVDDTGPRRARARSTTQQLAGRPGSADGRPRPDRAARSTSISSTPPAGGRGRLHDARPHDPGAGRAGAAPDRARVGRQGRDARSCSTRRTGGVLAMAQTPGYNDNDTPERRRSPTSATAPSPTPTSPGSTFKLVTITGALSEGLVTPHDAVHAAVPAPLRPAASSARSTTPSSARPRRSRSPRSSRSRRTSARSRSPRSSGRQALAELDREVRIRLSRPASTSRARARASCCRSTSGARRRSATSRSARGSR